MPKYQINYWYNFSKLAFLKPSPDKLLLCRTSDLHNYNQRCQHADWNRLLMCTFVPHCIQYKDEESTVVKHYNIFSFESYTVQRRSWKTNKKNYISGKTFQLVKFIWRFHLIVVVWLCLMTPVLPDILYTVQCFTKWRTSPHPSLSSTEPFEDVPFIHYTLHYLIMLSF